MCGLKFTLDDVTSILPDNMSGLEKKLHSGLSFNVSASWKKYSD